MQILPRGTIDVDDIIGSTHGISTLKVVGSYSVSGNIQYANDVSQLKYYKEPPNIKNVNFNLDANENTIYKSNDDREIRIDFVFKWILDNHDCLKPRDKNSTKWIDVEYIPLRGVMKKLMLTPFEKYDGWIISAVKFRGSIYLCYFEPEELKQKELNRTPQDMRNCAWGLKFKQYLLSGALDKDPDVSVPLNQNEELYCLFKSEFGNNKTLLYGGEIDGVCSKKIIKDSVVGKNLEFVDMKTIPSKYLSKGFVTDNRRILRWWAQNYLLGINSTICGSKDSCGIVKELYKVPLRKRSLEDKQKRCHSFCNGILQFVRNIVRKEYDECLYIFTYDQRERKITMEGISPDPKSEYTFLKPWYIKEVNNYFAKRNNVT